MVILMDTREQAPLDFSAYPLVTEVRRVALPVGDYMVEFIDGTRPPVVFERKSLSDLFGTMAGGYPRFKKELLQAKELSLQLVLGVEAHLSKVYQGCPPSQMSGQSCVQKLFTLWLKYDLYPVFAKGRDELTAYMVETFSALGRLYVAQKRKEAVRVDG